MLEGLIVAKRVGPGELNLLGIFQALATEFLAAVEQGRILHATQNIRESGGPLESAVRRTLSDLLPLTYSIGHGYLFDTQSKCTPQIDLIISRAQRRHSMLETSEGATYSPCSEAYAIGEIKASAAGMRSHLAQLGDRIASVEKMRQSLKEPTGWRFPELISFLIVGEAGQLKASAVISQYKNNPDSFPDFILLVGSGEIIRKPTGLPSFFDDLSQEIGPTQRPDGDRPVAFASGETLRERQGNALLWFFYALLNSLRRAEAHDMGLIYAKLAHDDDPWNDKAKQAADIASQSADPFALAMMRSIRLKTTGTLSEKNTAPKRTGRPAGSKKQMIQPKAK